MKCVREYGKFGIQRLPDKEAQEFVRAKKGIFMPKHKWKEQKEKKLC